jgi:hypothetical protein
VGLWGYVCGDMEYGGAWQRRLSCTTVVSVLARRRQDGPPPSSPSSGGSGGGGGVASTASPLPRTVHLSAAVWPPGCSCLLALADSG